MRSGAYASRRAARCDAGLEPSILSTSCPAAASASAMAFTVSAESNSASSSDSVRRRLWVKAIFTTAPATVIGDVGNTPDVEDQAATDAHCDRARVQSPLRSGRANDTSDG